MAKDETIIEAIPPGPGLAFDRYLEYHRRKLFEALKVPKEFLTGKPSSFNSAHILHAREEMRRRRG